MHFRPTFTYSTLVLCLLAVVNTFYSKEYSVFIRKGIRQTRMMTERITSRLPAIEVYSTLGCKFCRIAKAKLTELGVPYVSIDINDPGVISGDSANRTNQRVLHAQKNTVPQIYVDDEYVGGCTELLAEAATFPDSENILVQRLQRKGIQWSVSVCASKNGADEGDRAQRSTADFTPVKVKGEPLNSLRFAGLAGGVQQTNIVDVPVSAVELSKLLQQRALALTDKFASSDGKRVQYSAMVSSPEFADYVTLSCRLQQCSLRELATLTHSEKIAFYSNLYNALIIHANCVLRTKEINTTPSEDIGTLKASLTSPEAIAQRSLFFSGATGAVYRIGGAPVTSTGTGSEECEPTTDHVHAAVNIVNGCIDVTPDIIEHAILRANLPHPSQVTAALQQDSNANSIATNSATATAATTVRDAAHYYHTLSYLPAEHPIVVNQLPIDRELFDPRIHFILNCGALSCPPIKVLDSAQDSGGNVDAALGAATAAYLHGEVSVDLVQKVVFLPRLLLWYGQDIGADLTAVFARVVQYMPDGSETKAVLQSLLLRATDAREPGTKRVVFVTEVGAQLRTTAVECDNIDIFAVKYNPYDWSLNIE